MQYELHSGGQYGADAEWDRQAVIYGVKRIHYYHGRRTPLGNRLLSTPEFMEGCTKVRQANEILHRRPDLYMDLLARTWPVINKSDAVYAIVKNNNLKLSNIPGGTAWGIVMGIQARKPVYIFNQMRGIWMEYEHDKKFECFCAMSSPPALTERFAGIGTRDITEAGKEAIAEVYYKTFGLC